MATQSFYEDLIIDTPEKASRLIEAFGEANSKKSEKTPIDYYSLIEESDRVLLGRNP